MGIDPERLAWWRRQREVVVAYLAREGVDHAGVAEDPAFDVHPYVSLWAVQSRRAPGWVGWWAIAGDLPTDYVSSADGRTPRDALRALSRRWTDVAARMARGEHDPDVTIGTQEQGPQLAELLRRRAGLLAAWAADDARWGADGGPLDD